MFKRYKNPYEPETTQAQEPSYRAPLFNEDPPAPPPPPIAPRVYDTSTPEYEKEEVPQVPLTLEKEEPETTLGHGVVFKGSLNFSRLLRIDGIFEGELISDGKLVIGPTGRVKSNIRLKEAIIEGEVEGDIVVQERIELRGEAKVLGNIKARSMSVDEGVTLIGQVEICALSETRSQHSDI